MAQKDIKVYICDWCTSEAHVEVIHHRAGFSLGADTEDWSEAPMPQGWYEDVSSTASVRTKRLLCSDCRKELDSAIQETTERVKKKRAR